MGPDLCPVGPYRVLASTRYYVWMGTTATICGETTAKGTPCKRPAGYGTGHPGVGKCSRHRGNTPTHNIAAARPSLALLVGHNVDVNPMEALLMCVRITAAEVTYFSARISQLDHNTVVGRDREETVTSWGGAEGGYQILDLKKRRELNIWIKARQKSIEAMARYSKMALDAGVEERLVRVAEGIGEKLAKTLEAITQDLRLTPEQQELAPAIIRKHLTLLEGGNAA